MQKIMNRFEVSQIAIPVIKKMREATKGMIEPMSFSIVSLYGRDPFLILVSCLLSSQTKDSVTLPASLRLFKLGKTPREISKLSLMQIEKCVFPVCFYKEKAKNIQILCDQLITLYHEKVPSTFDELIILRGVGPKTANLVLGVGFGIPALCVDVHVHRISNRLGLVKTKNPLETEKALGALVPSEYWIELNRLLVMWGQNICKPVSPLCSGCPLRQMCRKIGVVKSR